MSQNRKKGFSLLKGLLLLVIAGVIVVALLPEYKESAEKGQMAEALMFGEGLDAAMADYVAEHGYPKGKNVEFLGTTPDDTLNMAQTLNSIAPNYSASKNFKYQAFCGEADGKEYCRWWAWSFDKGYSLFHETTKDEDRYECWIRNDEGEAFCNMLAAEDWIVEDDR